MDQCARRRTGPCTEATALALDAGTLSTHGTALLHAGGGEFARESYLAEHLPYFALADDDVMVLREGDLMATLRLDGALPCVDGSCLARFF